MSGTDLFVYVGAGAGWAFLIGAATRFLRERAMRSEMRRADAIADPIVRQVLMEAMDHIALGGPSLRARYAERAAQMAIEDLALVDRYAFARVARRDLVASRLEEVRAWRAVRRRQPLRRLDAFVRSAVRG